VCSTQPIWNTLIRQDMCRFTFCVRIHTSCTLATVRIVHVCIARALPKEERDPFNNQERKMKQNVILCSSQLLGRPVHRLIQYLPTLMHEL
jgi:hypothetical protein